MRPNAHTSTHINKILFIERERDSGGMVENLLNLSRLKMATSKDNAQRLEAQQRSRLTKTAIN